MTLIDDLDSGLYNNDIEFLSTSNPETSLFVNCPEFLTFLAEYKVSDVIEYMVNYILSNVEIFKDGNREEIGILIDRMLYLHKLIDKTEYEYYEYRALDEMLTKIIPFGCEGYECCES